MLKKLFVLTVLAMVAAGIWNKTRFAAATEQVRDAWIASQDQQKLENWDVHVQRQLRALKGQVETLERSAKADELACEVGQVRRDRLARDLESARALVLEFKARADAGSAFAIAGQEYSPALASAQLARYTAELGSLEQSVAAATAVVEARKSAVEQHRAQAVSLRERIAKFEDQARDLAARRQLLAAQAELRRLEGAKVGCCALDTKHLDELEALFRLAENELDRMEGEQRLDDKARPARTLSLEETVQKKVKY